MRSFAACLLLVGTVVLVPSTASSAQQTAPEAILHERDLMIPMRDGVKLATDIYRPARNGVPVEERLPIVLYRTPYNKTTPGRAEQAQFFARHGYVAVVQDTRGRYKSEGSFQKYNELDAPDGYDAIEWLAKLPYADGKVGMYGTSYNAHTQADAAKMNPPHLTTIVVNQGGISNGWKNSVRWHGAFEQRWQLSWALSNLRGELDNDALVDGILAIEKADEWLHALPLRKGQNPLSVSPDFEEYYLKQATQGDADWWKGLGVNWEEYYEQTADIPMLQIGGWFDYFCGGTIDNFVGLSAIKEGPIRLLMGPWTHGGNDESFAGDAEFGPEATIRDFHTYFQLRWLDHYLKGKGTGVEDHPPVRLFVMGSGDGHRDGNGRLFHGGYWRDEERWPLPGTRFREYYFHGDGSLSTTGPASGPESTTYTFDPDDPVPSIGGSFYGAEGGFNQRENEDCFGCEPPYLPLKARADVVVFQTQPLEEDVEVVGPIVVKLYAFSTALDTDFTAKLVDVYPASLGYPAGYDLGLTDGILRARYRNSPSSQELMTPGEVYEFTIEPYPTANVFKKGHRIRIDISSSNFPRFDVNPNTGESLGMERRKIKADNTIYHSSQYPSHVILPIVPSKR